jgi:hypothetical protein
VLLAAEYPAAATLDRLAREYELKDELDGTWAVRPLELVRDRGRTVLVLEARQYLRGGIGAARNPTVAYDRLGLVHDTKCKCQIDQVLIVLWRAAG